MRGLVAMVASVAAAAAVMGVLVGCTTAQSTGGTTATCAPVVPDGGNSVPDGGLACDVAWSCNSDMAHYELQCSLMGSNFECACFTEGIVGNTFIVNHFPCTATDAQPAATTNCGWTLM